MIQEQILDCITSLIATGLSMWLLWDYLPAGKACLGVALILFAFWRQVR